MKDISVNREEIPKCPVCGSTLNTERNTDDDPLLKGLSVQQAQFLKDVTTLWVCPKGCTFDEKQVEYFPYKKNGKYVSKKGLQGRDSAPHSKEYKTEMKKYKEKQAREKPYIVALEHKDFEQENVIINAETPEEALDILWENAPGVVKDCKKITIGLIEKIWGDEFFRGMCGNDKLHMEPLEDKISKLRET